FIAFAAWGSLFPFDFHAVPWSDAIARFWSAWDVPVSRWSRSDFVSNVLLFVPIGLFASAASAGRRASDALVAQPFRAGLRAWSRPEGLRYRSGLAVIAGSTALSTVIELGQAFVSWRTPSVVDVGAETIGAACGTVLWWSVGDRLDALVASG